MRHLRTCAGWYDTHLHCRTLTGTNNIFVNFLDLTAGSITPPAANKGNFKGGGLFRTNAQSLTADTTILATENANVTGPFTVASGVTLTVESGGTLVTL